MCYCSGNPSYRYTYLDESIYFILLHVSITTGADLHLFCVPALELIRVLYVLAYWHTHIGTDLWVLFCSIWLCTLGRIYMFFLSDRSLLSICNTGISCHGDQSCKWVAWACSSSHRGCEHSTHARWLDLLELRCNMARTNRLKGSINWATPF